MFRSKSIAVAVVSALAFGGAAMAQSAEDQAACRDDAVKFCRTAIGKPDDMKKCLLTNKDKLSASCKKVVETRGG
jgi:hypothetical protein